jgi:hypothetical protein
MPLFTSPRERRLWLGTAAILAAIYTTLGLAGKLAGFLRTNNLLEISFIFGLLLAVAATLSQWLQTQPGRREIWAILSIAAAYFMILTRIENPAERTHLFEYGLVAVFIFQALLERQRNGRHVPLPALMAIVVTALLGWIDEGIQAVLPNRVYDLRDVLFNSLAGLMAVLASLAMMRARQRQLQYREPAETIDDG